MDKAAVGAGGRGVASACSTEVGRLVALAGVVGETEGIGEVVVCGRVAVVVGWQAACTSNPSISPKITIRREMECTAGVWAQRMVVSG